MSDLTKVRIQLPYGSDPSRGPGWTNLWLREGSSDEDVLEEVWVLDCYHLRGLDLRDNRTLADDRDTPAPLVLDVGACTGLFAALVCQMFPNAYVTAVEPDPENFDLLVRNTAKWASRVTLLQQAISGDGGTRALVGDGANAHTIRDDNGSVASVTLAALLNEPHALLKLDVEGAEFDAIEACPSETLAVVDRIHAEWHGTREAPHVMDAPRRYGEMMTKLAFTHSATSFGRPDEGGYLFAHAYPTD